MELPARIGNHRILREIGRGGMGIVLEALQEDLDRRVALKVLPGLAAQNQTAVLRFQREATAAGRLSHPGIVQIHGAGRDGDWHFIVMELVEGENLANRIHRFWEAVTAEATGSRPQDLDATFFVDMESSDQLSASGVTSVADASNPVIPIVGKGDPKELRRLLKFVVQAGRALHAAHEGGVLHRDVKPGNLLITKDDQVKVVDFGLARSQESQSLTQSGDVMGTPRYISPEQLRSGHSVDRRADVYSLGVTLYEILTNHTPFEADSLSALVQRVLTEEPRPPRKINPAIPRDLDTVCLKAIEKDPARRYPTAKDFVDDLERFLSGEPIQARPSGPLSRTLKRIKRSPIVASAIGLSTVLALALVILAIGTGRWNREEDRRVALELTTKGLTSSILGDVHGALTLFGEALDRDKDNVEALVQRGLEHLMANRVQEASVDLERARRTRPDYLPQKLAYSIYEYLLGGAAPKAPSQEHIASLTTPLDLDAVGLLEEILGRHRNALDLFERARRLERSRISSLTGIALSDLFLGRFEEAARTYEALCTLLPDEMRPRVGLLLTLYLHHRSASDADKERLSRRADAAMDFLKTHTGECALACLGAALAQPAESRKHLDRALALEKNPSPNAPALDEFVFTELAALVALDHDLNRAEELARRALRIRPMSRFGDYVMAQVAARRGDDAGALLHFQKAYVRTPESPFVLKEYLETATRAGNPIELRKKLAKGILDSAPDMPLAYLLAAETLSEAGDPEHARAAAERCIEQVKRAGSPPEWRETLARAMRLASSAG